MSLTWLLPGLLIHTHLHRPPFAAAEAVKDDVPAVQQASQHARHGAGDIAHRLQGILSGAQNNITSFFSKLSKKR
eukprot:365810-Chlamydomonas_euryale.AAC.11